MLKGVDVLSNRGSAGHDLVHLLHTNTLLPQACCCACLFVLILLLKLFAQVISCFGLAAVSRLYVGFALVSLLVEINSVFLHTRQLLLLSGRRNRPGPEVASPRPSLAFSVVSWLNLGTFLVFRFCTLGWMACWLAGQSEGLPHYVLMMGTAGLSLMSIMNVVLFYRLLRADVLGNTNKSSKSH
ncbi:TLC domain-containing protein 2-like [Stegastes partitus]|uniref:TLC domain-containing protein 2-like n=1 Tax=Stegastes partitus TaxID=144197 RepID=A0A9Y4N7T8_9TELE|nr:PREDICTED: TLC domain-containing protein 2-like [Stegastes partitus]